MKKVYFLILVFIPLAVRATTWGESEVDDPILKGETCSVHEPMSYGGYIYNWPSKYDQVFWPLTDPNGIWFCEKSGFTAFIGDFEGLSTEEVQEIKQFLSDNPPKDSSIQTKLFLLEKLYSMRKTEKAFKNRILRVMARWYQDLGELDKANEYRKVALDSIKSDLEGELGEYQKLEYLYLAANYTKQFGNDEESGKYITLLKDVIAGVKDEEVKGFAEYLSELVENTKYITQGGALDPSISND